ncbi:MAG: hypothetical protein RIK87_10745 [Fuerstiella sp.]
MQCPKDSENPYKAASWVNHRIGGVVRSFRVGVDEINTVFVESSLWSGLRTHFVDATGMPGTVYRGPCRFETGQRERHQVAIEVDGLGRVNAYVDGVLAEENLFASVRSRIVLSTTGIVVAVALAVVVFLYFWIRYAPDRIIDRWIESLM